MPGFILHLTAAQMLLKHLPSHPDFPYPISSVNDFLIGNLLPDATQQKESSHFRDPLYREKWWYSRILHGLQRNTVHFCQIRAHWDIIFIFILTGNFLRISFRRLWNFIMRMEKLQIWEMRLQRFISKNRGHPFLFQISHGGVLLRGLYTNEYISCQPLLHPARSQS